MSEMVIIKLLLIGDSEVGKSAVSLNFCENTFLTPIETYKPTEDVEIREKALALGQKGIINLQIWDTPGVEWFYSVHTCKKLFSEAKGVMFIYDITKERTFQRIESRWIKRVEEHVPSDVPKMLVGNKSDMADRRSVSTERGAQLAKKYGMKFLEISAENSKNVNMAFSTLARDVHIAWAPGTAVIGMYNFRGHHSEHLSFKKGDVLYIINRKYREWYTAKNAINLTGLIPMNYVQELDDREWKQTFDRCLWLRGDITRVQAEELLKSQRDGSFLVRTTNKGGFVLCVCNNSLVHHYEVRITPDDQFTLNDGYFFDKLTSLVEFYHQYTSNLCTSLVYPLGKEEETNYFAVDKESFQTVAGMKALVLFDRDAKETNELTLQKGDVVDIIRRCDEIGEGWLEGQISSKIGLFPANYVKIIAKKPVQVAGMKALVLFDYDAEEADELTLRKGDVVDIIRGSDEVGEKGWWEGQISGKIGLFLSDFVEIIAEKPGQVAGMKALVLFDRDAKETDELTLQKGDVVDIIRRSVEIGEGWWEGQISSKIGFFPSNYVKIIAEKPVQVPPEILARGNLALEAYNNALREGTTCVKRVPVMLIGQDRSGKTSLKKSLRGQRFNPDEDSTVGIDKDPSYFKVTTEIWKAGDKGEATNSDTAISYEYHAAQIIVNNLTEEAPVEAPVEAPAELINYEITSLSSDDESAENLRPASNENQNPNEIAQEQDPSGRLPITDIESSPTHEFPSVSPELSDTNFQSSDASRIDDASSSSDEPKVPDEIAALVERLLLEVNNAKEEKDIYSVLWDFGGQSVYYVTHPLFLTPRAVYLLVYDLSRSPHDKAKPIPMEGMFETFEDQFNLKTNQDYLDFWMTSVSSLANQDDVRQAHTGPTSDVLPEKLPPVFLVCTHADKPHDGRDPFELAREIFNTLQRKPYSGQLVEHVFVVDNTKSASQSECEEVIRLRQEVLAVAKELPQTKEAIPIKWLKYEKALRATTEEEGFKWISLQTAKRIASEVCEINDDQEFLTLLNFLHDQRILVHFDDNAVLNSLVILDPQWLIDVFKKVITVKPYDHKEREFKELWFKLETTGILEEALLQHVWSPFLEEQETSESLTAMMQKFSLLCPWPSSDTSGSKQYLVPSMLMSYPPQEVINLVASAQIPSLFLKFKSGQIPPSFFPRLVLQFFKWCLEEFPTQVTPKLFHNFARFYISSDTGCSVVLLCHFSDVEVIFLGESRDVAKSVQPGLNWSAGVSHDSCDVSLACIVGNQLALIVYSMRNEFCWLKNMRCEVSFLCPVCSKGGVVDYCQNHRAQACKQEECLHFFSVSEVLKSKQIIICTRSAIAQDNRVQIKQFTPWFAFDFEKNEATSEDCDRLLPSAQTLVIPRPHENTLALPCEVVQTLQSPCSPQEVVVQLQEHLQLNQSSLDKPDSETKKWIRCLATEAKRSNRLDVVRHLRDISPAGTTGPLLPEQLDIQYISVGQMMELTMDLSGGDEWKVVAEKLGLTPKQIRFLEKRTMNPSDAALAFVSQRCYISVGELYDLLNECGLPVIADNL